MKEKFKQMKGIRKKDNQYGITLIALVITIIVLLILAGVSIAMLTGQNGILTQAQKAKTETENAAKNEAGILNDYEDKINKALGVKEQAEPGKYYETDTEVELGGKTLTIPGGASISKILGEYESIDNGLVIYITNKQITDEEWQDTEKMQTTYDQFVWIPVTSSKQYGRNNDYNISNNWAFDITKVYTGNDYLPDEIQPNIPENLTDAKEIGRLNEKAESTAVVNAGGFYISRYEMAKDEDENLVSKKGTVAEFSESIDNLKSISKNFSTSSPNLKSALCSGIQWDVVMDLVKEKTGFDVNVVHDEFYTNGKQPAGTNPENKFFNIYDLEGNRLEYTSEQISSSIYIERGGSRIYPESYPASARLTGQEIMDGYGDSFRLVLYII